MHDLYTDYWRSLKSRRRLRIPLILSLALHATVLGLFMRALLKDPPAPIPISYDVSVVSAMTEDRPEPEPEP